MKRPDYLNQIRGNIEKAENGSVFVSTDFTDITDKKTVNMGLIRLADEGLYRLRRCAHICRALAEHSEPLFGRGYQRRGILGPPR